MEQRIALPLLLPLGTTVLEPNLTHFHNEFKDTGSLSWNENFRTMISILIKSIISLGTFKRFLL